MSQISLERTFAPNPEALVRDVDREAVLLDLEAGTYFGLNSVGTRIWHLLEHDGRLRIVFDALCDEYEAPPGDIERDLLALVTRLVDARLGVLR